MDKISFLDLGEKHSKNSKQIQEIERLGVTRQYQIEALKSQIEAFEKQIEASEKQIEVFEKQIEAINTKKMKDFEKMTVEPMQEIRRVDGEIRRVKGEIKRVEDEIKELEVADDEKEKLSLENVKIMEEAKTRKDELKEQVEKEYQEKLAKIEKEYKKGLEEAEKKETKELKKARKELEDYKKQLERQEEEEKNHPNKAKNSKWKDFLKQEIAKRETIIEEKDQKGSYEIIREDGLRAIEEDREEKIKLIDKKYLEFKKSTSKDYMPEEYKKANPVVEEVKRKRKEKEEAVLNTEELFEELREDGDLPKRNNNEVPKDNRAFSKEQQEAWKGGKRFSTDELYNDKNIENPLNTEELFEELREDGYLPKRNNNEVPKDNRTFSEEQQKAWKGGERLNTEEIFRELKNISIKFDLLKGQYIYIDEEKGIEKSLDIFDKDGKEKFKEKKKEWQDVLSNFGMSKKKVQGIDPYICILLTEFRPELVRKYIDAIDDPSNGLEGIDIKYDLRKQKNGKKYSLMQKLENYRKSRYHEENNLAKVIRSKSKTKLYGVLAALGITSFGAGAYALNSANEQKPTEKTKIEKDIKTQPTTTPVQKVVPFQEKEEIKMPTQGKEEVKTPNQDKEEKDIRIGKYVTVRKGAHLYKDPYDAVHEALGNKTNEEVVVKGIEDNQMYKVTMEGLYCPDGTCIEIENGDLKTAMEKNGIDTKILENIDTEQLEKQGYRRMLHVTASGIAEWIEEGDSLEVQLDRFGNRINKTQSEIEADSKTTPKDRQQVEELNR